MALSYILLQLKHCAAPMHGSTLLAIIRQLLLPSYLLYKVTHMGAGCDSIQA